jgi:hypothetical protein
MLSTYTVFIVAVRGDKNVHYIESLDVGTGSCDHNEVTELSQVNCLVYRCNNTYSMHVYKLLVSFITVEIFVKCASDLLCW